MMRLHPMCPKCDEEFLLVIRDKTWAKLLCRECGWYAMLIPPPADADLNAAIERAVKEAQGK